MNRSIYLAAAAVLALAACKQNSAGNTTPANDMNAMSGNIDMTANATNTAETNMAATNAAATTTTSAADKAFLTDAMKGDNDEVALGNLAQKKGASSGVKDLAKMLVSDHSAHKQQVADLAKQSGVAVTDDLKTEAKSEETKLNGLTGAAFDKEFARATVENHKKDITKYDKEAKGTGPVAQMAQQTLPVLKKHLAAAEKLAK